MALDAQHFKTNFPEWHRAFEDWVVASGLGIVDAFRYQCRMIGSALVLGYEPSGSKNWNQSTPPNDRKQGEAAVRRDVRRSIYPLTSKGFRNVKVKRRVEDALRSEDVSKLQMMVQQGVFGHDRTSMKVLPAGNEFTAHQNSRVSRGRVLLKQPRFAIPARTMSYIKSYTAEAMHGVGQAKGGWANGLFALGGKVPPWIARHRKAGAARDNLKPNQTEIGFSFINRSKWGAYDDEGEARRIAESVMRNRENLITADIKFLIERGWQRDTQGRILR